MDKYIYADALAEELQVWAYLDGCEGGDLLRSLASTIGMAHYSYVDEDEFLAKLAQLAIVEIDQHASNVANEDEASYFGHDSWEAVMEVKDKISDIWKRAWRAE